MNNSTRLFFFMFMLILTTGWQRQGHATHRVRSSKDFASTIVIVRRFARLRAFQEANVKAAFSAVVIALSPAN
ncbi:hypothetical protein CASFOL_026639 [Castilleja foliolosa]|uniref:Secreted protein n=1 Tax=Castilleja foliolosa TaxID=1961234 RepID=A0ABD3CLC1_9LAMI